MEKVWLKSYPKGIPIEINPEEFQSIVQMFDKSCNDFSDSKAFYNLGVTITYSQLYDYSKKVAAFLQNDLGLKKGERVAIMLPNILQYPILMLGILRAGLIVVNVNPLYTPPELAHQIQDSGAETLFVLENFANTVQKTLETIPIKNIIITRIGDLFPWIKGCITHLFLKYIKKAIKPWNIPHALSFKKILHLNSNFQPVTINSEDVAFLQYTGGTTGIAKGAMLTHRNIISNVLQAKAWFSQMLEFKKEIMITALPLYHIFSLTGNCLFISSIGGLNILITNPRDIPSLIKEMSKFKFTVITGVNTLFNALLKNDEFSKLDFSALKLSLGGGMAVQRVVAENWKKITGLPLLEAYGLTETSPSVTINPTTIDEYNGTIGLPVPSTEVAILDDDGSLLPLGQAGEIAVKGPQVMKGYWNNPSETSKVFNKDGWLLTGDVGSMDENGFVKILERKKDMILVSGFNVYPNEIEDTLMKLKGVREAAVIGVPDNGSGEVVKAFIVREDPNLTEKDVLQFCHDNLTGYKRPKSVQFCNDLPKTNVGKISRRALRETSV